MSRRVFELGGARRQLAGRGAPILSACAVPMVAVAPRAVAIGHLRSATEHQSRDAYRRWLRASSVRIADGNGQRNAVRRRAEPLGRGERLRIGYQPGGHHYLSRCRSTNAAWCRRLVRPDRARSVAIMDEGRPARRASCPAAGTGPARARSGSSWCSPTSRSTSRRRSARRAPPTLEGRGGDSRPVAQRSACRANSSTDVREP